MNFLDIVVPMAGAGSRFAQAGYTDPKPLIPIHGVPMIRVIIENLRPTRAHRFTFVCQRAHDEAYGLTDLLGSWAPGCNVVLIDGLTEGAACTVLAARDAIDPSSELMIANSDQYVDTDINEYLSRQSADQLDGLIMTMTAHDPKWSFVGLDGTGLVNRVVEKQVISNEATVGIYNFRSAGDFFRAADQMIARDLRVNGEFYVAPVYEQLIDLGARIGVFNVGAEAAGMYGLGIPSDLELFSSLAVSGKATAGLA